MVFLCTEVSEHYIITYTQTPSAEKTTTQKTKTGKINLYACWIHLYPHLLKMSGQMSDNTVQASHFPPDLTVFGLLGRSPPVNPGQFKKTATKKENRRESL